MKLKLILFAAILTISPTLLAQHKPFQFGFKAAANIGWYNSSNDDYNNEGVKFGGSWGFAADFYLLENYSITTGFDVLYLNGSMSYPDNYYFENLSFPKQGILTREFNTKYLRIPVLFTMKTNEINKLRYYGQIGLGIGFLLTAKSDDSFLADADGMTESSSNNVYDDFRFTRESVLVGAGVEFPVYKSTYARVGVLFDNALINILKGNNTVDSSEKHNGRNSFIEINASILF